MFLSINKAMAKKKGSNKMTYRPLKNSNMIGAGKKESVEQILKRGSNAKPPDKTHVQHVKAQTPKPTKTQQIMAEKAKLAQKPSPPKTVEKEKPKAPVKGR